MALSCLENINTPTCIWFEGGDRRNVLASMFAGFLFFLGWWIAIDAESFYPHQIAAGHVCGAFGALSLIMVNSISNSQLRGDAYEGGCLGSRGAKAFLFCGFVFGFASLIASCFILFAKFVNKTPHWPGVGLLLQNVLIFIASLVYKFGRSEDLWV